MNGLNKKAIGGLLWLFVVMAALIFIPAWTLNYWQGWAFLALFFIPSLATTIYLMNDDPRLLERRVRGGAAAEKEVSQKIIQNIASIAFIAILVVSALDHRFYWSAVPLYATITGDLLVVVGFYIVFLVFKENAFASATIETDEEQEVVSTGPYAVVRHPMYVGSLLLLLGTPLALGSLWGLLAFILIALVIVWRILDEERFLANKLPGYTEYMGRVKCRLIPFIW